MAEHERDPLNYRVEYIGPFQHHDVVVDGWAVPFLTMHPEGEDRVDLVIDRRLAASFTVEEAERVVPFVADAIAVALGYGAFPDRESEPPLDRLPHSRPIRTHGIVFMEDEEADGGE